MRFGRPIVVVQPALRRCEQPADRRIQAQLLTRGDDRTQRGQRAVCVLRGFGEVLQRDEWKEQPLDALRGDERAGVPPDPGAGFR